LINLIKSFIDLLETVFAISNFNDILAFFFQSLRAYDYLFGTLYH